MADVEKSAVFKVEIDFGDFQKNQEDIQSRINNIRNEQVKLDVSSKENQKTFAENNKTLKALEGQLKINAKALNEITQAERANTDTTNFNNNSIKQNRELFKELNAEYIRIVKPTKEQTENLKNLNTVLKSQESAIGNNVRGVGSYKEAFLEGLKSVKLFGTGLVDLFKMILTNPIGLIVIAFTSLYALLQKFEPVFDFFERALAGISGAITGVLGNINKLLTLDFSGFIEGVSSAAAESYNLAAAIQDAEDAQRAFNVETAKSEALVKNLIIQSKDRTLTEKQRLDLLKQAAKQEESNFKRALELAVEDKRIADQKLNIAERNGQANDALRDAAAAAEIKLIQLQSSSADLQEKIENRKNALLQASQDKRDADEKKRQDQAAKNAAAEEKRLSDLQKRAEEAIKIFNETTNAEFAFTTNAVNIFYEQQAELLRQNLANNLLTQEEYDAQYLALQQEKLTTQGQVLQDYSTTVKGLEDDIARNQIEKDKLVTDQKLANNKKVADDKKKKAEDEKRIADDLYKTQRQFALQSADIIASAIQQEGDLIENFTKGVAVSVLNILEQQAIASATIQSLISPESIATGGIGGLIKAGIIISLIKAAFGTFKAAISGFANGGIVGIDDGIPIQRSNGDNRIITVKTGEVILNKAQQTILGGPSAMAAAGVPGFSSSGQIESVRNIVQEKVMDSEWIIQAIKELNISVSVTEINEVSNKLQRQAQIAEL